MATNVRKVVVGPLTGFPEEIPGVRFVMGDGDAAEVLGSVNAIELGMTEKQVKSLPAIIARLIGHAISQKVGDGYAGAASEENPLGAIRDAIKGGIEQLLKGDWRVTTAGGFRVTMLARALARVTGNDPKEAQGVIDANSDLDDEGKPSETGKAWLKALRGQAAIKEATQALKEEDLAAAKARGVKGAADVDLGSLFAK